MLYVMIVSSGKGKLYRWFVAKVFTENFFSLLPSRLASLCFSYVSSLCRCRVLRFTSSVRLGLTLDSDNSPIPLLRYRRNFREFENKTRRKKKRKFTRSEEDALCRMVSIFSLQAVTRKLDSYHSKTLVSFYICTIFYAAAHTTPNPNHHHPAHQFFQQDGRRGERGIKTYKELLIHFQRTRQQDMGYYSLLVFVTNEYRKKVLTK